MGYPGSRATLGHKLIWVTNISQEVQGSYKNLVNMILEYQTASYNTSWDNQATFFEGVIVPVKESLGIKSKKARRSSRRCEYIRNSIHWLHYLIGLRL